MTHLIQLTDENDVFLGHKMRNEVVHTDITRCVFIHISDPTESFVLLQKRSFEKNTYPGLWSHSVSGALDAHDTYESGALREIEEEIGVSGCQLIGHGVKFRPNSSGGGTQRMVYSTRIPMDSKLILQESEVADARWVSVEELRAWTAASPDDFVPGALELWRELGVL